MSKRVELFLSGWIFENVNAGPYDPGPAVVEPLVEQLLTDAAAEGITREEIEESRGDVDDIISDALEAATDNEVARLAAKGD